MTNAEEGGKKCRHVKEDGEQCQAWSMGGSEFCYLHNPEVSEEEKKEAMAKGGKANRPMVKTPLVGITINSTEDILTMIAATLGELRAGQVDGNIAKAVFYGCGCYLKAYEMTSLEARLTSMETKLASDYYRH